MLALPQPLPMPHAVLPDQSFASAFPRLPHPKLDSLSPSSLAPSTSSRVASFQPATASSWDTPPQEMSVTAPYDAARGEGYVPRRGLEPMGRQAGYAGPAMPYASAQSSLYPMSQPLEQRQQQPSNPSPTPSRSAMSTMTSMAAADPRPQDSAPKSVAPSLRIPHTIPAPQQSMPQLAAEVTCLFWFEDSSLLQQIENTRIIPRTVPALAPAAIPSIGFQKWATTIITTTQVTPNVVLLALLFIYRLKKINPHVKGKEGSEYRLFTVALMLGNKFLDDNTYTNKTWADVSGISVQEVHLMEVEFLSNMRYGLFVSEDEWVDWHSKLAKFGGWVDRAIRPIETVTRPMTVHAPTLHVPPALPSPPHSNHASPPYVLHHSPNPPLANTPLLLPQVSSASVSPIGPLPELDFRNGRKRSYDDSAQEPPPKRTASGLHFSQSGPLPSVNTATMPTAAGLPHTLPRLPALTIPVAQQGPYPTPQSVQLPPPSGRAMAMVYPPPVQWSQPPVPTSVSAPTLPPTSQGYATAMPDRTRQLSPYPGSNNNSPTNANFPPSATHTANQSRLSPSYFLQQRSSPYRPVRGVTTLLVPPPSGALLNQPRSVNYDQMQYQPLGRPGERRAGHVPYMHHEAWPETHQLNHWPVLPQPVTHH